MVNEQPYGPGGDRLVADGVRRYGRFAQRPVRANPLDEFSRPARAARRLRLKEWIGFMLVHPDWFSSFIIQDANYLSSSEIYAYDRAEGALYQHARTGGPGAVALPEKLIGSSPVFAAKGYRLEYAFADDGHRLAFDIAASAAAPAFAGELHLDPARASAPLVVSSRLPGGRMFTDKVIFPVSGALRVGSKEIVFDPGRDLAVLDEHRSLLPYRTRWVWGTFAAASPAGPIGANFVDRPELPGEQEESCLWTPGRCEPLAGIHFEQKTPSNPLSEWHIASADGRLEVTFTPEGRKAVRHQLLVFEIDYFQLFGTYRGAIRSADGTTLEIASAHGVCESMRARL